MIEVFKKNDFTKDYLKFVEDFEINIKSKSKIIFAPNGTGKTSIYKVTKENHPEFEFIDYDEIRQSMIDKKKKITIGTNILLLQTKKEVKESKLNELAIDKVFKGLSITNSTHDSNISDNFGRSATEIEDMILNFEATKLSTIFDNLAEDGMFMAKNFKLFKDASDISAEIQSIKDNVMKSVYDNIDKILTEGETICPICGYENIVPIKKILDDKRLKLVEISNDLVKLFCEINHTENPEIIVKRVNNIIDLINSEEIKETDIFSYLIIGGEADKINDISKIATELKKLNQEIEQLEKERNVFYEKLKLAEEEIKYLFVNELNVKENKILLDDKEKVLKITLEREVKDYSTGEINLIVLIVNLYQFVHSDKDLLILDDPLSSYDLINQYKIMFEVINSINEKKRILIFTHNIDSIAIANSQCSGIFSSYAIEKNSDNKLFLNDLKNLEGSLFNIDKILNENAEEEHIGYINLLVEREVSPDKDNIDPIFHYDEDYTYKDKTGTTYSNNLLVKLIDDFDESTFENNGFYKNAYMKIMYLCSIRVWIEKQFKDTLNDDNLKKKKLGRKIDYIFDEKAGINRWTGNSKVTRRKLMSKKVMINQNEHYKSQIAPFYYVLNISFKDLTKEIKYIKDMFLN